MKKQLRSSFSTQGRRMAGARALWAANGMKKNQMGKPIIAIVNSFTQFVPGHVHLHEIGQLVKAEIEKLGCFAAEFNTIAIDDGIAMGHDGMLYSLPSRDIIADSVEYMVNELYIAASSDSEGNFELTRNHKLFQANYLMGAGDYRAALNSYRELNLLFEQNHQFWSNPPIYYLSVLEGVLGSLRTVGGYEEMPYFLEKLRKLIVEDSSLEFKINATCLLFQYELFPYLDRGDFPKCTELMNRYKETLYDKEAWLSPIRKSELFLYTTLIHIGNQNYKAAKKYISNAIVDHNIKYLPLMRTIRLVRLIAYYETQEFELIRYESRSITRNLSSPKEQTFKTEHIVLWFLNKSNLPILRKDREAFWEKLYPEIRELYNDKYENQLLRIFDFTAWIESKIRKENLSEVLKQRTNAKEF